MAHDDWRIRVELPEEHGHGLLERLRLRSPAHELAKELEGRRLAVIVHHDDMEREYAYDRESRIGRLDKALDEAKARKWIVVSMKDDWKRIFPWEATP